LPLFVESVEVLRSAGALWRHLAWVGALMAGAGLLLWLRPPFRARD